jgi:mono/diheme cytochrome c family protein
MSRVSFRRATILFSLLLIGAVALSVFEGCQKSQQSTSQSQTTGVMQAQDPVARGKYLVTVASCNDCHTPKLPPTGPLPETDMTRLLSGHPHDEAITSGPNSADKTWVWGGNPGMTAFYGPWGVSFAANLSPDTTTGLGGWSEDMFIQTLRNGKHMGTGRNLIPPMPWNWINQMTDEDLKAVFAYLKSIPAVHNEVPQPIPPKS